MIFVGKGYALAQSRDRVYAVSNPCARPHPRYVQQDVQQHAQHVQQRPHP